MIEDTILDYNLIAEEVKKIRKKELSSPSEIWIYKSGRVNYDDFISKYGDFHIPNFNDSKTLQDIFINLVETHQKTDPEIKQDIDIIIKNIVKNKLTNMKIEVTNKQAEELDTELIENKFNCKINIIKNGNTIFDIHF